MFSLAASIEKSAVHEALFKFCVFEAEVAEKGGSFPPRFSHIRRSENVSIFDNMVFIEPFCAFNS